MAHLYNYVHDAWLISEKHNSYTLEIYSLIYSTRIILWYAALGEQLFGHRDTMIQLLKDRKYPLAVIVVGFGVTVGHTE